MDITGNRGKTFKMTSTECFGQYKRSDQLCWELCAIRLSCAIENNRIGHIEIMEDLIANDGLIIKI